MTTTVKGFLKGLRYITQIFDEEKDNEMQIGFPTDVKHVAHIGSDGPAANTPSWMSDFKPQENENSQIVSRDGNNTQIGEGVGLQELLPPPEKEKPKQKKTRRKSETASQNGSPPRRSSNVSSSDMIPKQSRRKSETVSQSGSPPRRNSSVTSSDMTPKQSRRNHHRSRHGSIDSSNDPSVRRRHRVVTVSNENEGSYPLSDGSAPPRKSGSRHRKLKGSGGGGELSMKIKTTTKGKTENSTIVQSVDKCNDNNISDKD